MDIVSPESSQDFESAIKELCVRLPVSVGAAGLAKALSSLAPELRFHDALTRGGWFRLGGIVDGEGQRVSDTLTEWGERELARHGDDLNDLYDAYADRDFRATRLIGRTHYLVAASGMQAAEFIQVEIEELQEVVSHVLFAEAAPNSLDEAFEPPTSGDAQNGMNAPVSLPFYSLRRVVDVSHLVQRIALQRPGPQSLHRFLESWQRSSAGATTHFCNHWLIGVRESLNRYRQTTVQATPVAALNGPAPEFSNPQGAKGMALNECLQRFDRQVGYPMAWFFHLITTRAVPQTVAHAVIDDIQDGYQYLPDRDVTVLKDWLRRPFGF